MYIAGTYALVQVFIADFIWVSGFGMVECNFGIGNGHNPQNVLLDS